MGIALKSSLVQTSRNESPTTGSLCRAGTCNPIDARAEKDIFSTLLLLQKELTIVIKTNTSQISAVRAGVGFSFFFFTLPF